MIIAGIDEAGYGPLLGPLTVGCCAMRVIRPAEVSDSTDLWSLLDRAVARKRSTRGLLHVADSKRVYTPAQGLRELERSVLAFVACRVANDSAPTGTFDSLNALLERLLTDRGEDVASLPWYCPTELEKHPAEITPDAATLAHGMLRRSLVESGVEVVAARVHAVSEKRLNRLFDAMRNKSAVSFNFVAEHMQYLLDHFADEGLLIWCDRQGGREHYDAVLRTMFEGWDVAIEGETTERAEYSLRQKVPPRRAAGSDKRSDAVVRLIFSEKAEERAMPVALASMFAKYVREVLMHRFNAYWLARAPGVKPTAGYWTDGQRFVKEIADAARKEGVRLQELIRSR